MPGSRSKSCAESLLGVPFLVRSHVGFPIEDSIGWNVERVDTVHPAKGALRTALEVTASSVKPVRLGISSTLRRPFDESCVIEGAYPLRESLNGAEPQ